MAEGDSLADFPIVIEIPVAWGELDAFGHVNNTVYFRYFESARIACFDALDYLTLMRNTGVGPILASTDCRFRIPLTYPDRLRVGTRITAVGADEFTMGYAVQSEHHSRLAAEGSARVVSFDYEERRKAPLQPELRKRLMRFVPPS